MESQTLEVGETGQPKGEEGKVRVKRRVSKLFHKTCSFNYEHMSNVLMSKLAMRVADEDSQPMLCPTVRLKECEDLVYHNDLKCTMQRRLSNCHEYCYENNINIISSEMHRRRYLRSQSMVRRG
jgi:hypothetical protein